MIRTISRALLSLVAVVGLAGTANAAFVPTTWTDDYDGPARLLGGSGPSSFSYQHDITGAGFQVGSDLVTSFLLTIDLRDDQFGDGSEIAYIDVPGIFSDAIVSTFSYVNNEFQGGLSIAGLFELNLWGTLSVTITALRGDFLFLDSTLVANGFTSSSSTRVPEPSTLALLGLGLLGVAFGANRRRA